MYGLKQMLRLFNIVLVIFRNIMVYFNALIIVSLYVNNKIKIIKGIALDIFTYTYISLLKSSIASTDGMQGVQQPPIVCKKKSFICVLYRCCLHWQTRVLQLIIPRQAAPRWKSSS